MMRSKMKAILLKLKIRDKELLNDGIACALDAVSEKTFRDGSGMTSTLN